MDKRIRELARAVDEQLWNVELSPSGRARVRQRLRQRATSRAGGRRGLWVVGVAVVASVLAFVVTRGFASDSAQVTIDTAQTLASDSLASRLRVASAPVVATAPKGWRLRTPACTFAEDGGIVELHRHCFLELDQPRLTVLTWADSVIRRVDGGVAVDKGWITFEVAKVRSTGFVRVELPWGVVEVLGTRFTVRVNDSEGELRLSEGSIRLTEPQGRVRVLSPGDVVRWGQPAPTATVGAAAALGEVGRRAKGARSASARPASKSRVERASPQVEPAPAGLDDDQLAAALRRLAKLRAGARYAEALALVTKLGAAVQDARTLEVLSYEKGTLLKHGGDERGACTHWRKHLKRFVRGRYEDQVRRHQRELSCDD